jgi:hypothetical protein
MGEARLLGVRAYARHRGCTHHAVQKAIKTGRLSAASVGRNSKGHPAIDPAAADKEWDQNTDALQQREPAPPKPLPESPPAPPSAPDAAGQTGLFGELPISPAASPPDPMAKPGGISLASAQAVRTAYQAQIAKLEYEERSGQLCKVEGVKLEAFRLARLTRERLLGISDRLSAELASESDQQIIRRRLNEELRLCLSELARLAS